ncbi:hypothetical protein [Candidatus Palauibacter sp.]|uniref:hypothetical protein n=1 Tax=Candidatus Palauibacter sp. TaxID=3101350 RepID=UPI003B019D9C
MTVADTIMTVDTLLRVDTVTVADTIMTVDTLVRVDTVRVSTPTHKREWTPDVTRSAAAAMFNPFTRIAAGSSIAACGVAGRVYVVSDTGELVWDDCEERGWYFNGRATEVLANNLQTTSGRLRFASYATDETCDFVEEITSTRLAITICDVPFEVTRSSDESSSRLRVR